MYLAHHVSQRGILPSQENVQAMQEFPMPETYMQVHAFCGLAGHYRRFIKGFANIVHPLYDVLGKKVKMGPVDLLPEAQKAMAVLKGKVQSAPVLVFPDFEKPFLLETDASKEGLGAVLSQKQSDGWYHPIASGSHSLTPVEKNYHSSKLEFLTLKWSMMEHFKEYLAYAPFVVRTDNNPLTYVLTMPNLDTMGHQWVGALASFQFELEYQKGTDNGAVDVLSQVPINHSQQTIQSLLKGVIVGASDRGEAKANEGLLEEHERLSREARVQVAKLELMHIVDWEQAQEVDVTLGMSNFGHTKSAIKNFARFPTFHFWEGGTSNFGHAKSAIKKFQQISNFSFPGGGDMSNFGHAKSAIKNFHQISNFSFLGGRYIELWSCQTCHKKIFTRFPTFHFQVGGTLNFGHAKFAIKNFRQISNFLFPGGGGVHLQVDR